jgi:hypothetical protein
MRKSLATLFTTAAAAALAFGVGQMPASAATWTVSPGGAFSASSSNTVLTNGSNQIKCASSRVSGTLQASSSDGVHIGTLSSVAFDNGTPGTTCPGPAGSTWTVSTVTPWFLNAESYAPGTNPPTTGVTTGTITDVNAHLVGNVPIFGRCSFDVTGSVGGTYSNSNAVLSVKTSSLTIGNVSGSGCGVAGISNGQHPTFTGDYTVTPAQIITSP